MVIDMVNKDYRIEVRVRNNWLLKKIEDEGYESIADFARKSKINQAHVSSFVTFREPPKNSKGQWTITFLKIAEALRCLPEDICPPQHHDKGLKKNKAVFEADVGEVAGYLTGNEDTARPAIDHIIEEERGRVITEVMSQRLTPREERILRLRFGLTEDGKEETLREVAERFDLSVDRIRQIEAKACSKLRHPTWSKKLREYGNPSRYRHQLPERHYVPQWKKQEAKQKMEEAKNRAEHIRKEAQVLKTALTYVEMIRILHGDKYLKEAEDEHAI